jgi:hypothetical protein
MSQAAVAEFPSLANRPRPIMRDAPLDVAIVADEPRLSGLVVRFGTFMRENAAGVEVAITRARTGETKSLVLDAATLEDNALVTLRFVPFQHAAGERFLVSMRCDAGAESCVAAFLTPTGALETRLLYGELVVDGARVVLPPDLIVQTVDRRPGPPAHPSGLGYALTHWWVDRFGVYLDGSLTLERPAAIQALRLASGDAACELAFEPGNAPGTGRFWGYLPCRAGEPITLSADADGRSVSTRLIVPYEPLPPSASPELFRAFIARVNREHGSVLEVGARRSSPFSLCYRSHFEPHVRFVGFDILPGDNVDVVGDAHHLTRHFPEQSLGAAYSLTVLEHLLMPWRFAVELNRVLEMGALVYHATHQTWPVHAAPNDFYRFSDEALKFLFGPPAGFEIVDAHMEHLVWLYPEERTSKHFLETPLFPGYGNSQVVARKVRHVEPGRDPWETAAAGLAERSRQYPLAEAG